MRTFFAFASATAAALAEFPAASSGATTLSISLVYPPGAGFHSVQQRSRSAPVLPPLSPCSQIISENP